MNGWADVWRNEANLTGIIVLADTSPLPLKPIFWSEENNNLISHLEIPSEQRQIWHDDAVAVVVAAGFSLSIRQFFTIFCFRRFCFVSSRNHRRRRRHEREQKMYLNVRGVLSLPSKLMLVLYQVVADGVTSFNVLLLLLFAVMELLLQMQQQQLSSTSLLLFLVCHSGCFKSGLNSFPPFSRQKGRKFVVVGFQLRRQCRTRLVQELFCARLQK